MKYRDTLIALALLAPAAALGQVPAAGAPADSAAEGAEQLRAVYDSGFAGILAGLPASASNASSELWPLWVLGGYRQRSVGWMRLTDGGYQPVVAGARMPAWLVVVPPGTTGLARMRRPLEMDTSRSVHVARIASFAVTPTWAAIFLFRQLSLLYHHAEELGSRAASADEIAKLELQAADVELAAADFVARGDFRDSLDVMLERWRVASPEQLADSIVRARPAVLQRILAAVPAEAARSREEGELRSGVAATSLLVRYCGLHDLETAACASQLRRLALLKQAGLGGASSPP